MDFISENDVTYHNGKYPLVSDKMILKLIKKEKSELITEINF